MATADWLRVPNNQIAESIRTRAELARRLARELKDPNAVKALTEIAGALEDEAAKLEQNVIDIK